MLKVKGVDSPGQALAQEYQRGSIQQRTLDLMTEGDDLYSYESLDELRFELELRAATVQASKDLLKSGLGFEVFRETFCNTDYWKREQDGGFSLRRDVSPAAAIRDIYENGRKYGTECATAMQIVYYKALLDALGEEKFNKNFGKMYLMNWHGLESEISEVGRIHPVSDFLPGDRLYFKNPQVNPKTPQWQGENVIDLGDGTFYGHGVGRLPAETIIKALNRNRRPGATEEAYQMQAAGRPDFTKLYAL